MAIQMNVSGLRRNLKNIAHNYTDAQVKVREATSNDPWGPSSTLMSEIADLTYNVVAFSEIMQMIWKRLNDHGRNWRHVYKALVLLEYLIKTGSEKIAEQCKENIFAIQTLKDFQYLEENKDMGINVREKAKSLVALLKDDERLRNERVRALKAKERFAQSVSGIGSDSDINSPSSPSYPDTFVTSSARHERQAFGVSEHSIPTSPTTELENARPQTVGEEELQLQLAIAMSKEEADQEEAKRKSDDVRLQMALSQSEVDYNSDDLGSSSVMDSRDKNREKDKSALKDLLDINFNPNGMAASSSMSALPSSAASAVDPWGIPVGSAVSSGSMSPKNTSVNLLPKADPWGLPIVNRDANTPKQHDPWNSPSSAPPSRVTSPPTTNDPWIPAPSKSPETTAIDDPWTPKPTNDPWSATSAPPPTNTQVDPFAPIVTDNGDDFSSISSRVVTSNNGADDVFDLTGFESDLPSENGLRSKPKSPNAFLGENSNLVNLDNLVSVRPSPVGMGGTSSPSYQNMNSLHNNNNNNNNPLNGLNFASDFEFGTNKIVNANPNTLHNSTSDSTCNNNNNNPFLSHAAANNPPALASSFVPGVNPFSGGPSPPNPFQAQQVPKPSMNELRTQGPSPSLNSPWGPANNLDRDSGSPFMI